MKKINLVYKDKPIYYFTWIDKLSMLFYPMITKKTEEGTLKFKVRKDGTIYLYDFKLSEK